MDDRPFANITGELFAENTDDVAVNNFLEYKCPGDASNQLQNFIVKLHIQIEHPK